MYLPLDLLKQKEQRKERGRKSSCQPSENQGNVTVLGPPGTVTYKQIQLQKKSQTTAPSGPGSGPPGRARPVASQPNLPASLSLHCSEAWVSSAFLPPSLWSLLFTHRGYYGNRKSLFC